MNNPKRHWIRFSVRRLVLVVPLVAVWLGWNVHVVAERKEALDQLRRRVDGSHVLSASYLSRVYKVPASAEVSLLRQYLGDEAISAITFPEDAPESELQAVADLFPEANFGRGNPTERLFAPR